MKLSHRLGALVAALANVAAVRDARCPEAVAVWEGGRQVGTVCAQREAADRGLTTIDLQDRWTPAVFAAGADGVAPDYARIYQALAAERFADAELDARWGRSDRFLELYGIPPNLSVLRTRLADDARHACHARVPAAALLGVTDRLVEEEADAARLRLQGVRARRDSLESERRRRHLDSLAALGASDAHLRRAVERALAEERTEAMLRALQAHLACEGLVGGRVQPPPAYTWHTRNAVEVLQRRELLLPDGILDQDTRAAFAVDSRERDFRAALRALRERVVAASGLIEDGTAGDGEAPVLGRLLTPPRTVEVRGHLPLEGAAPDLIARATEAAARALGWRDAASTRAFLEAHGPASADPLGRVALRLPPPPPYHRAGMAITAEIDRGDVWYDARPRHREATRRPALLVYAIDGDRRVPLCRWPTTIGGWRDEKRGDEALVKRWKESPVGPRLWRQLLIAPTWLPPPTTPDRELVRRAGATRYELRRESLGPSYRSAYGVVALVHERPVPRRGTDVGAVAVDFDDEGIRTHGTGNLSSLASGVSHGCHRLLGMHAERLAGFLLAHRAWRRLGPQPADYHRVVRFGEPFPVHIRTRGYLVELTPPVPIEVLAGTIRSGGTPPRE